MLGEGILDLSMCIDLVNAGTEGISNYRCVLDLVNAGTEGILDLIDVY